jgi:hypothetical protein
MEKKPLRTTLAETNNVIVQIDLDENSELSHAANFGENRAYCSNSYSMSRQLGPTLRSTTKGTARA